jgi:hypothetical protein
MNTETIEQRIRVLTTERQGLEAAHNTLVQQNQKTNQEFQQEVVKNQTRFAQLTGGITELQKLLEPNERTDNHDNRIPTLDRSDRTLDVRVGQ